jgi:hypothetical protein
MSVYFECSEICLNWILYNSELLSPTVGIFFFIILTCINKMAVYFECKSWLQGGLV